MEIKKRQVEVNKHDWNKVMLSVYGGLQSQRQGRQCWCDSLVSFEFAQWLSDFLGATLPPTLLSSSPLPPHQPHERGDSQTLGPLSSVVFRLDGQEERNANKSTPPEKRKNYIKKPLNAFMLFMKEMRPKVIAECTLRESSAINQILGRKASLAVIVSLCSGGTSAEALLFGSWRFGPSFVMGQTRLLEGGGEGGGCVCVCGLRMVCVSVCACICVCLMCEICQTFCRKIWFMP